MGCKVNTPPKVSGYRFTVSNSSSYAPKQLLSSGRLHTSRTGGSSQESAVTSLLPLKLLLLVQRKSLLLVLILQHQEAAQESVVAIVYVACK